MVTLYSQIQSIFDSAVHFMMSSKPRRNGKLQVYFDLTQSLYDGTDIERARDDKAYFIWRR